MKNVLVGRNVSRSTEGEQACTTIVAQLRQINKVVSFPFHHASLTEKKKKRPSVESFRDANGCLPLVPTFYAHTAIRTIMRVETQKNRRAKRYFRHYCPRARKINKTPHLLQVPTKRNKHHTYSRYPEYYLVCSHNKTQTPHLLQVPRILL